MKKTEEKSLEQRRREIQFLEDYLEIYMVKSDSRPTKDLFLEDYLFECLEEIDCDASYEDPTLCRAYESVCSQR
ncbi:hypothetical protein [Fusibacter ferrireducens]|uniref:Uncharacterized protein n=1 Tax=Fusibacter ferrireducens TaxID=2785058 RepID=A0ABR9ZXD6_9FIRM|nr:hypothetical protein [Fusibacter ferrireducens]MBF4694264.1 hypothetical protein [Fusibacter ferrireducens]